MGGESEKRTVKGILLDVDYIDREDSSAIRLFVKTKKGIEIFLDKKFHPYFYAAGDESAAKAIKEAVFGENTKALSVEKANGNLLKVVFERVRGLTDARKEIRELPEVDMIYEYDVPFAKRYLIDKALEPTSGIELEVKGENVKAVQIAGCNIELNYAAFDMETLSPGRFSDPLRDPILMISFVKEGLEKVLTTHEKLKGKKEIEFFESEKEMVRAFFKLLEEEKVDVLVTYNGDGFDIPYLKDRCGALGIKPLFYPANEPPSIRSIGRDNYARLHGMQHLDAYQMLRFLNRFVVVSLVKFDLESVAMSLFGEEKEKIKAEQINEIWESGNGIERLANYCMADSRTTLKIALQYVPLILELCRLVKQTLFDASRSSASMLVEYLLMNKAFVEGKTVPNKPSDEESSQRLLQTYKGGFVKEPIPGLHERLAVLDFSSLHPSIMISHNISPETIGCKHKECESNESPNKYRFCTKEEGFVSEILKELFERRMKIKKEVKAMDKANPERHLLNARQQALKILMNSFYGYLGYARSRWFSRECASAVTAWSRHYVQLVLEEAEKRGFEALYGDTDSAFLIIPKEKSEKDVKKFVEEINASLPGVMNLELEGFFKRGIFVTKESGEGAKKKYALIDYEGNLKIVGFEYVRRDWSPVARETQRAVIAAVLEEGKPEEAVRIVRETIKRIKDGKASKSELVVLTQLKRAIGKYDAIGPHVAAAQKAVDKGKELGAGSVIAYIITKRGKSISDKAQLEEYVEEGNYDSEYYIGHQVVPAVIKIMRELGYSKEDLIHGGKQSKLGSFF